MVTTLLATRRASLAAVLIMAASLWIRMAFPVAAFGSAMHDDQLFVRLAAEIGMGNWLGNYNNLTHAKGIGYPLFLLANHAVGLPLKFSEHLLYLLAALFFSAAVCRINQSRTAGWLIFIVLAFTPVAWMAGATGRVMREGLYTPESLALLAFGLYCWVLPHAKPNAPSHLWFSSTNWKLHTSFGLVAGLFWLTREEGVWLAPPMLVMAAYSVWSVRRSRGEWRACVISLVMPAVIAAVIVGAVNLANYGVYGVFRNNDFRSADFQAGYGALARIRHQSWQRYVVFPKDAREKAYAMSAAARELRPFLEGPVGEQWRQLGCAQTGRPVCPEILSGWFMWALRDAVAAAGYYRDAEAASNFYWRLAEEIDQGCAQDASVCLSVRNTLVPPWREEYLRDTILGAYWLYRTLTTFNMESPSLVASGGTPKQLKFFALVTNGPLAPTEGELQLEPHLVSPRDNARLLIASTVTEWQRVFMSQGLPAAMLGWAVWVLAALIRRRLTGPLIVATALVAAVVTRLGLLGFLEISAIPSNNLLYLTPAIPMALALPVVMGWAVFHGMHYSPLFSGVRQWIAVRENQ